MRSLIVGAGGVGGYFGARLAEAGADVTFLLRSDRAQALRERGLRLTSPLGDWVGKISVVEASELSEEFDLIVLACKAYDLPGALCSIAPAVTPGTSLLPLLNGVAHLKRVSAAFPDADLWGGVAHLGVSVDGGDTVRHLNELATFLFCPLDNNLQGERLAAELQASIADVPIDARIELNIRQAMWEKLVFLGTLAGVTCLMRADIGTILRTEPGGATIGRLLDECAMIAEAEGFRPSDDVLAQYRRQLFDPSSTSKASMLRDIEAGRQTENDHVLGDLVRRGQAHGIATPTLQSAFAGVQCYELLRERSTS